MYLCHSSTFETATQKMQMYCFNVTDQSVEGMERGTNGIKGRMWYGMKIQNKCFPIDFQWPVAVEH